MRIYEKDKIIEIYCNKCGKKIEVKNDVLKEGVLSIDKRWGYFSDRDGIQHSFDICEECYNKIIGRFKYPVTETEYSELI